MIQQQETLLVMDADAIRKAIRRIAHEIIERNDDLSRLVVAGIPTRGVEVARRIVEHIEAIEGVRPGLRHRWTSPCTAMTFPREEGQRRSSPHNFPLSSMDGRSFLSTTCSLPAGAVARPGCDFFVWPASPDSICGSCGSRPPRVADSRGLCREESSHDTGRANQSSFENLDGTPDSVTVVRPS